MISEEMKDKVVLALTSTTRHQIRDNIVDSSGGACALGVLAEALAGFDLEEHIGTSAYEGTFAAGTPLVELLPGQFLKELGYRNDGVRGFLPHTFDEIAKWVKNLPTVY